MNDMIKPIPASDAFRWEDIVVGQTLRSSQYRVTEAEIIDFASRYDPMPTHVDPEAAASSQFGSVIAAGSHMLAIRQRLVHDFAFAAGVVASVGHEQVRFLAPLRAGQSCRVEVNFIAKRPSAKRRDRGIVVVEMTLLADEVPVLTMRDVALMVARGEAVQDA